MHSTLITETTPHAQTVTLQDSERTRCEVWTRVMGYHRPVASFNIGKKGEFAERQFFNECAIPANQPAATVSTTETSSTEAA